MLAPVSFVLLSMSAGASLEAPAPSVHAVHRQARPTPAHRTPRTLDAPSALGTFNAMVYGYFAPWAGTVADLPWDRLTHVAIFSVDLTASGGFTGLANWHDHAPQAMELAAPYGVKVHLAVTSFDSGTMSTVLGNPSTRATAVEGLRQLVDEYGAHGVAVDFEGMSASNNADLVAFCEELAAVVDEVTVATPAIDWNGAYDYDQLAATTDGLFIMGYDYHWKGGDPGPVAPLAGGAPWGMYSLEWSIDDYITWGTPPEKIILGLPLYGYQWPTTGTNVPGSATGNASAVLFADAVADAEAAGRQWDETTSTPYWFPTGSSQAWYDDTESLDAKIQLAMDEGLGGIGFWAVNYEGGDPEFWDMVAAHTQTPDRPNPDPDPDPDPEPGTTSGGDETGDGPTDPPAGETGDGEPPSDPDEPEGSSDGGVATEGDTSQLDGDADEGCACTTTDRRQAPLWALAILVPLAIARRRRA